MTFPHTNYPKGKRVRIVLRDGSVIIDKYIEKTGKFIITENHRLRGRDIKAMSDYKERHNGNHEETR